MGGANGVTLLFFPSVNMAVGGANGVALRFFPSVNMAAVLLVLGGARDGIFLALPCPLLSLYGGKLALVK